MPLNQAPATAIPRPLGTLEKLFWLADQNRPMHFAIAAEVGGSTRIKQWQDALDRVCRQSALIWCRIVPDERGAPVFTPVPYGSIPLHVVKNAMSEWTAHVAGQLDQPFDASRARCPGSTMRLSIGNSSPVARSNRTLSVPSAMAIRRGCLSVCRVRISTRCARSRN